MNTVSIIGNFGQDPELKYFETGGILCNLSISTDDYNTKTKEKVTHWIDCQAWGKTAENIGEYFQKGSKIAITGRLLTKTWQEENSKNRKKMYVLIDRFDFLQKKDKNPDENIPNF